MKYDIRFIQKYWKKHKKQAITFLMIYIILVTYLLVSFCMVRTELRRIYFENQANHSESGRFYGYYTAGSGAYNHLFYGMDDEKIAELMQEPWVEDCQTVYVSGSLGVSDWRYTCGAFSGERAKVLSGYHLEAGRYPEKSGEIAVSRLALENMCGNAELDKSITLLRYDKEGKHVGELDAKVVGVIQDNGQRESWETCLKSINKYFEPTILLPLEDVDISDCSRYAMIRITDGQRIGSYTETRAEELNKRIETYFEYGAGFGIGAYDSSYFTKLSGVSTNEYDGTVKQEKVYFYEYTGIIAAVLMAVTLSSGLLALFPTRMKSLRLLWQNGYTVKRLRCMLMLECGMFTIGGLLAGFIVAMGVYEILLQIQYRVFGLELFRGYFAEWGISQITYSPIGYTLGITCVVSVLSYLMVCLYVSRSRLEKVEKPTRVKHGKVCNIGLFRKVGRVINHRGIATLQVSALVMVLMIATAAYMFFSTNGKSSSGNPQISMQGNLFQTQLGLDRRIIRADATIERRNATAAAGLFELDVSAGYGFSYDKVAQLESSELFEKCLAWSNVITYARYPKGSKVSPLLKLYPREWYAEGEQEWYGLGDYDVYCMDDPAKSSILVGDEFLERILGATEAGKMLSDNGVVVVTANGRSPFKEGEEIPMFAAGGVFRDEAHYDYDLDNVVMYEVRVDKVIKAESFKDDPMLSGILNKLSAQYIIIYPYKTAETVDLPKKNLEQIYLQYAPPATDRKVKKLVHELNTGKADMGVTTTADCQEQFDRVMLKEYSIVFTIFGLLFVLAMIGYMQTLKLQVFRCEEQIHLFATMGMTGQRMGKMLFFHLMKIPILAVCLAGVGVVGMKTFLHNRYERVLELKELARRASIKYPPDFQLQDQYKMQCNELTNRFFTDYEMWKVPVASLFVLLSGMVLVVAAVMVVYVIRKVIKKDMQRREMGSRE